jgi:hypothetical protein
MEWLGSTTSPWLSVQGWDRLAFYGTIFGSIIAFTFALAVLLARTNVGYLKEQSAIAARLQAELDAAPRALKPDQRKEMASSAEKSKVAQIQSIAVLSFGSEAASYADEISSVLQSAGWVVNRISVGMSNVATTGVAVHRNGGDVAGIHAALAAAKIRYQDAADNAFIPVPGSVRASIAGMPVLVVGFKPN